MSQLLRELPALLLLFALVKPIVCGNHELPRPRRERSSYVDTSQYVTDHSGIAEDNRNVHRSRKLLQEQPVYQYPDYQQTYPPNPPRYPPFPPQYPQPYVGVYGPTYPQPYPQPYSNQYGEQYAPPFRQPQQSHYQPELKPRRTSSSSVGDDNLFSIFEVGPERLKLFNNTSINPHLNHKLPEQALTESSPTPKVKKSTTVNDTISNIFRIGSKPFELFNNTSVSSELNHMQADQAIFDVPSTRVQPFKVQRAPDGKLNLVFNESLFFQNTSTQPTVYRPISPPKRAPSNEDDSRYGAFCSSTSRSKSLCTNATNYPEPRELEALFRQSNIWKYEVFFGQDAEPLPNITQRMNGHPDEEPLCVSREKIIYPQAGETKDSNWLFIINTDSFKQGVRVEECIQDTTKGDIPCSAVVSPRNGYTTRCKQKYVYRRLVGLTMDRQNVTLEDFKIPSCCSCVVIQVGL